jgi:hypothetical protein
MRSTTSVSCSALVDRSLRPNTDDEVGRTMSDVNPWTWLHLYRVAQYLATTSGSLPVGEALARWQALCRAALPHVARRRPPDVASVYDEMRTAILQVGGHERDLETLAYLEVLQAVELPDPDARDRQLNLIAEHIVQTVMTVRVGQGDPPVRMEFPNRPSRH